MDHEDTLGVTRPLPVRRKTMATLSLRMRDDLKQKAQQLAKEQGISLNGFVNATIAAAVAQQETLMFFSDRLRGVDQEALHQRVLKLMRNTRSGKEPSTEEIERAMRG
jgi:hypothetical protein